jgi:putative ABC transport system permease protein
MFNDAFKDHWKTSVRFLVKNKGFSLLNIIGLSVGTLCCVYILVYVKEQYSYDRWFSDVRHLYRVTQRTPTAQGERLQATTALPMGPTMASELRDELFSTRVIPAIGCDQHLVAHNGKGAYEKDAYLVDSNFFTLFDFPFISGEAATALAAPNSVVLTQTLADKIFDKTEGRIGKSIQVSNSWGDFQFTVGGIIDEGRGRTSLHAGIFFRMDPNGFGSEFLREDHWDDHQFAYTFIKLKPGAFADDLKKKLPGFLDRHLDKSMVKPQLRLQRVTELHTSGRYSSEMSKTVSSFFLAVLTAIAALIQLVACINFMNLSTARASKRAKEVGVRKIIGADNKELVRQFLVESLLFAFIAVLVTVPLLITTLPWLNRMTGADLPRTIFFDPLVWLLLTGVAIVTGLLAGSYPAFFLSSFQATRVLKGDFTSQISATGIRKALVVFQFVLSIILISSIIIIRQQLDYMEKKDLGFNKDEQIVLNFYIWKAQRCANYFAIAMRQFPDVRDACRTDNYPGAMRYRDEHIYKRGSGAETAVGAQVLASDEHFLRTLGIGLVSGRDLQVGDSGSVLINQTLAQQLQLDSANAPGSGVVTPDGKQYTIAGVMKDFNFQSLHDKVSPFMVIYKSGINDFDHLILSVHPTSYASLLNEMNIIWKRRVFVAPFNFRFLNDEVQKLYETEIVMSRIINSFTGMAVLISCLGLFGLAAFSAEQRTKEIGIRKVMGASVPGIVGLLSADFLKLIVIAFLIAAPLGWWAMHRWLDVFAYHVPISGWTFALAGGSLLVIAMSVVGYQALKAAVINPIRSLRAE